MQRSYWRFFQFYSNPTQHAVLTDYIRFCYFCRNEMEITVTGQNIFKICIKIQLIIVEKYNLTQIWIETQQCILSDEHINEFCGQPTYDFLIQLIIYFNLMILIKWALKNECCKVKQFLVKKWDSVQRGENCLEKFLKMWTVSTWLFKCAICLKIKKFELF